MSVQPVGEERLENLPAPEASANWAAMLRLAAAVIFFTFFVLGGWSAVARLDSAIVANGTVAVETNRKTIQHLEGGIVREILVRDGDTVHEGDVLVRLDPTRSAATDATYRQQLAVALAVEARLLAQRDMRDKVTFPNEVTSLKDNPQIAAAIRDNLSQFQNRREALMRGIDVFEKQIAQTKDEVAQAEVDQKTAQDQLDSINIELPNLKTLLDKGLVALPRVTTLERQQMQTKGALENAKLNYSKGQQKIGELQARIESLRQDYRQEAAAALPDVGKTIGDARQQLVIANDALQRIDIKAPVTGTVQQMRIFTVGGVIKPGDPILDIVPLSDTLVVRARVTPTDIDRILPGMKVEIRVPQFMRYQLDPIYGYVRSVSHDTVVDQTAPTAAQQQPYFAVEVAVGRNAIPEVARDRITAGMIVDAIILTQERTVLSYLIGPIRDRLDKSLRER